MSGQQVTASGPLHATERTRAYLAALKATPERPPARMPVDRLVGGARHARPDHGRRLSISVRCST